jgi:hypothetical protein
MLPPWASGRIDSAGSSQQSAKEQSAKKAISKRAISKTIISVQQSVAISSQRHSAPKAEAGYAPRSKSEGYGYGNSKTLRC